LCTDVVGQPISPILKGQEVQEWAHRGAVRSEPCAVSSDEDRLAAVKLQTRRLSGTQRKQLIKIREGGGEK
jgi:hypothetical protein